jgi:hypothetical protein
MSISTRNAEHKDESTTVSVHVHAPENVGFTHTVKTRFTHFEGSNSGGRDTFGMPAKKLNEVMQDFIKKFYANEKQSQRQHGHPDMPADVRASLDVCAAEISVLAESYRKGLVYNNPAAMVEVVLETGHIPLIMSACTAAAQYKMATRNLSSGHLETYFKVTPFSKKQAIEYVVKVQMMKKIAELYAFVNNLRLSKYADNSKPDFYACTRFMIALNNDVIKVNQESMPKQYVQFDLASTFAENILKKICQMNPAIVGEKFINSIYNTLGTISGNTVAAQDSISKYLYQQLNDFVDKCDFTPDADGDTPKETDDKLQEILPLAQYLNSEFNPFARNGIKGKLLTSTFHEAALQAYRNHESTCNYYNPREEYQYNETPRTEEFNGDQMEVLIYGAEEKKSASKASSASSRFFKALTEGNTVTDSSQSDAAKRRETLALPTPEIYTRLYITEGKEENKTQSNDAAPRPGNR